jgi:hypothetical protein
MKWCFNKKLCKFIFHKTELTETYLKRQKGRQRDKETIRQRERDTETQRDRETVRQ